MAFLAHALLLAYAIRLLDQAWDELEYTNSERLEIMRLSFSEDWKRVKAFAQGLRSGKVEDEVRIILDRLRNKGDQVPPPEAEEPVERLG